MDKFEIPVVVLIFKRKDKIKKIMDRISQVKPTKIYILADGPRNEDERLVVEECRKSVEESITWECQVIKNYAETNRGVYENIGMGAKWVFEREDCAIFLEDDNLPEISFFKFCEELLGKYREDTRVLWICGTNYLEKYQPKDGASYVFTKHMMPCGWASWSDKFLKYYDGNLNLLEDNNLVSRMKTQYEDIRLYKQQITLAKMEKERINNNLKPFSWDYQMEFTIRANNLYGISPSHNQIENIGVDNDSIHGGSNFSDIMTKRFCSIKSFPLNYPLIHPKTVLSDDEYEKRVGKIILYPIEMRVKKSISIFLRRKLKVPENTSIKNYLLKRLFNKNSL